MLEGLEDLAVLVFKRNVFGKEGVAGRLEGPSSYESWIMRIEESRAGGAHFTGKRVEADAG